MRKEPKRRIIWSSYFDYADWEDDVPSMKGEGIIPEDWDDEQCEEYCRDLHHEYMYDEQANMDYPCTLVAAGGVSLWDKTIEGYQIADNLNKCFQMSGVDGDYRVEIYVQGESLKGHFSHHDAPMGYELEFFIVKDNAPSSFLEKLKYGEATYSQIRRWCYCAGRKVREIYGF